ncbi:hypothetical protein JG688_00006163 [Phytophthora aleatoria]|uniref:Secreted protein n=1 Tax=Phytophthora aleatoria TaxID=2496075 RepID=A0A8J5J1A3_9STRA|nr:hypothetical protein JG688_00006163 [Phytophthora aleatoria]
MQGTPWNIFLLFLRRSWSRLLLFKAIKTLNLAIAGRRGGRALEEAELLDGMYLCVAYKHSFVGHAFVIRVQGGRDFCTSTIKSRFRCRQPGLISSLLFVHSSHSRRSR